MELLSGKNTKNPNWLNLPTDLMKIILQRLDTVEIVTSARIVCPLWWNICKDPLNLIWRNIHISETHLRQFNFSSLEKICRCIIDLSCGHLEDIDIEFIVTDDLLKYMALGASHLRRLRLYRCDKISDKVLIESVKNFSLLEELDISFNNNVVEDFLEDIGRYCPLLKSLSLHKLSYSSQCNEELFAIAEKMPGIQHLTLSGIDFDIGGLVAIRICCPKNKSIHLHNCYHVHLKRFENLKFVYDGRGDDQAYGGDDFEQTYSNDDEEYIFDD